MATLHVDPVASCGKSAVDSAEPQAGAAERPSTPALLLSKPDLRRSGDARTGFGKQRRQRCGSARTASHSRARACTAQTPSGGDPEGITAAEWA